MQRPKRNFDNYGSAKKKEIVDGSDRKVDTPLGEVRILDFKLEMPMGFRKMHITEGR